MAIALVVTCLARVIYSSCARPCPGMAQRYRYDAGAINLCRGFDLFRLHRPLLSVTQAMTRRISFNFPLREK
jgi:hypothetical protein